MNPKHIELPGGAIRKFGILSTRKVLQIFHDWHRELNDDLIVDANPGAVSADQKAVSELSKLDQEIFIVSAQPDLRNVRESTLESSTFPFTERSRNVSKSHCTALQPISNILDMK
jgi:hypothetical protein